MYTRKPDHRIELTDKGKAQAREAGKRLRDLLGPDETVYVYVSPYLRTMQTLYELGMAVGPDRVLGVREELAYASRISATSRTPPCAS